MVIQGVFHSTESLFECIERSSLTTLALKQESGARDNVTCKTFPLPGSRWFHLSAFLIVWLESCTWVFTSKDMRSDVLFMIKGN